MHWVILLCNRHNIFIVHVEFTLTQVSITGMWSVSFHNVSQYFFVFVCVETASYIIIQQLHLTRAGLGEPCYHTHPQKPKSQGRSLETRLDISTHLFGKCCIFSISAVLWNTYQEPLPLLCQSSCTDLKCIKNLAIPRQDCLLSSLLCDCWFKNKIKISMQPRSLKNIYPLISKAGYISSECYKLVGRVTVTINQLLTVSLFLLLRNGWKGISPCHDCQSTTHE